VKHDIQSILCVNNNNSKDLLLTVIFHNKEERIHRLEVKKSGAKRRINTVEVVEDFHIGIFRCNEIL